MAGQIHAMLQNRVLVAHNAQFDYDFLAHEFARARMFLPVSQRLCTLALSRRVDPPTEDLRLGTLAAHYGIPQLKAHDALDDTRVLAGPAPAAATPKEQPAPISVVRAPHDGERASSRPEPAIAAEPLSGRRVLVLGGTHPHAAAGRTRIVELGGAAAINLSAGVTDVFLLAGGEADRRMRRIEALAIPTYTGDWLDAPTLAAVPRPSPGRRGPLVLPRGGVVDLPGQERSPLWHLTAWWAQQTTCEVDLVAFVVDEDEQVSCDEDFIFYGAPESTDGTLRLLADGPTEQTITADLSALPPSVRKIVIAAAIDGTPTFGDVGAIQVTAGAGSSVLPLAQAALDAATTERTMLLAEIYRRGPVWRFRAIGQGYDDGLDALARRYGVEVQG